MALGMHELLRGIFKNDEWKFQLLSEWTSIVGNLSDKMRLEKIDNDTLVIGVYQATWLQELYLLSNVLLHSINKHLKHPHVKKLRFKHASVHEHKNTSQEAAVVEPLKKVQPFILSYDERRALSTIKDQDLKQALQGFLQRCHTQRNLS